MRTTKRAAVMAIVATAWMLALLPTPAHAQAAAPNCPPGQPSGRPPGTPPGNPPVPTGRPDYPPGRCQLALSSSAAARGETFTATGGGFVPGEEVTLSIAGSKMTTVLADANGAFSVELTVPSAAPLGRTQVLASAPSLELSAAFEVLAPAAASRGAASERRAAGGLVRTGSDATSLASLGLSLVLIGGIALVIVRRRRLALEEGWLS